MREKALKIAKLLRDRFGAAVPSKIPPLERAIITVLSQNTADTLAHRVFEELKGRFPNLYSIVDAPPDEVLRIMKKCGLPHQKYRTTVSILRVAMERGGLDFLGKMDPKEAFKFLTSIKGIGPKTAAIVLLFSFGMEFFPVDTHIMRVAKRVGLIPGNLRDRGKAQEILAGLFPPNLYAEVHLNLIKLGKTFCKATKPLCEDCPLKGECETWHQKLRRCS